MTAGVLSRRRRGGIWTVSASIVVVLGLLYVFQVRRHDNRLRRGLVSFAKVTMKPPLAHSIALPLPLFSRCPHRHPQYHSL